MLGLECNSIYDIFILLHIISYIVYADAVQLGSQCKLSVQETVRDWTAVVKVNLTPGGWRNYHGFTFFLS